MEVSEKSYQVEQFETKSTPTSPARYTSEINMPDSLALYSQLGVSPPEEKWKMPTDDCNQLFDWDTGYINPKLVPTQIGDDA